MKTLTELFRESDQEIQSGIITQVEKRIKCSHCGKERLVPGYIHDYNCQNCKTITDVNNSAITSQTWNNIRYNTKVRKKIDKTEIAAPDLPQRKRKVLNRT